MSEPVEPLAGIRVLDLTQYVSGPYCTQVLADLGATVLKVERPGRGDVYRGQGPVFRNGESASFLTLNRGKRSVELDLQSAADRPALDRLIGEADVLVENMKPGTLARYELDYERLHERHPRLVYCSISAFGQTGPLAPQGGYDLTVQALSGIMSLTGHPGQPPAKVPVAALDFGSALYAVIGILSALAQRHATGTGQWVQTSILETGLAWLSMHITTLLMGGPEPSQLGTGSPFFAPYEAYRTADGHMVVVGTGGDAAWGAFCAAIGVEHLVDDPRFLANSDRVANVVELREEIERVMSTRSNAHWATVLEAAGVPFAPVQRLAEVIGSEQVRALGTLTTLEHPAAGAIPVVRLPITMSASSSMASDPPPRLGERGDLAFAPDDRTSDV